MPKLIKKGWDVLAIAAITLAALAILVYALPAPTGDVYSVNNRYQGEQGCEPGDIQLSTDSYGGDNNNYFTDYVCDKGQPFSPDRIPLAAVAGFAAMFLLVFRLRPATRGRR
jgi:hypothetical protein